MFHCCQLALSDEGTDSSDRYRYSDYMTARHMILTYFSCWVHHFVGSESPKHCFDGGQPTREWSGSRVGMADTLFKLGSSNNLQIYHVGYITRELWHLPSILYITNAKTTSIFSTSLSVTWCIIFSWYSINKLCPSKDMLAEGLAKPPMRGSFGSLPSYGHSIASDWHVYLHFIHHIPGIQRWACTYDCSWCNLFYRTIPLIRC